MTDQTPGEGPARERQFALLASARTLSMLLVCGVVMVVTTLGALASPGVRNLVAPGPATPAVPGTSIDSGTTGSRTASGPAGRGDTNTAPSAVAGGAANPVHPLS